jgi:hypothetical protein
MPQHKVRVPVLVEIEMLVEAENPQEAIDIAIDCIAIRSIQPKKDLGKNIKEVRVGDVVAYENLKAAFLPKAESVAVEENNF